MFFKTHEDWEIKDPSLKIFEAPGTRYYPFIELSLNFNLFHVDILPHYDDEDGFAPMLRFIATDIRQALILVDDKHVNKFSISLQSRRCDNANGEYCISTLSEVLEAEDSAGQLAHIYVCKDGKRVIDSSLASTESELFNARSVYIDGRKPSEGIQ